MYWIIYTYDFDKKICAASFTTWEELIKWQNQNKVDILDITKSCG